MFSGRNLPTSRRNLPCIFYHAYWRSTDFLTPWSRDLLQKITGFQLVKDFPTFCGTRRFVIAFTNTHQLSLSWAISIQSILPPHPTSWRSILILSSNLRLGLASGLFPSGFPTKTLCTPLLSPIHATCPSHLILPDFITRKILGEEYRSLSSSLCSFLHSSSTSSLLGPNILLSIIFSNALSLRSSLNVSDQVSHPYITKGSTFLWNGCGFLQNASHFLPEWSSSVIHSYSYTTCFNTENSAFCPHGFYLLHTVLTIKW